MTREAASDTGRITGRSSVPATPAAERRVRAQMDKSPPPQTYEEAVAQVREQLRSQKQSGRPARTYEELVEEIKERIRRASNPKDRAEFERVLLEFEAHAAKTAELRAKLAKLARRYDQSNRTSPFIVGMWLVGLPAVVIIGIILAKHYF